MKGQSTNSRHRFLLFGAGTLGLVLAGVLFAQQPTTNVLVVNTGGFSSTPSGVAGSGQKAFVDPQTGALREPTAAEAQALAALQGTPTTTAQPTIFAADGNGSGIAVVVPEELQTSLAATRNADGTVSMVHVDGAGRKAVSPQAGTGLTQKKEQPNDR